MSFSNASSSSTPPPYSVMLSRARVRRSSTVHCDDATPMTGTLRSSFFTIA